MPDRSVWSSLIVTPAWKKRDKYRDIFFFTEEVEEAMLEMDEWEERDSEGLCEIIETWTPEIGPVGVYFFLSICWYLLKVILPRAQSIFISQGAAG